MKVLALNVSEEQISTTTREQKFTSGLLVLFHQYICLLLSQYHTVLIARVL